jgi:hypothetical protein
MWTSQWICLDIVDLLCISIAWIQDCLDIWDREGVEAGLCVAFTFTFISCHSCCILTYIFFSHASTMISFVYYNRCCDILTRRYLMYHTIKLAHTQTSHPNYPNHPTTFVYRPPPYHHTFSPPFTYNRRYCPEQQHEIAYHARAHMPLFLRKLRAEYTHCKDDTRVYDQECRGMSFVRDGRVGKVS